MGKRIIQRARGKGGPPYKSPSHRFPGKISYSFNEFGEVVDIIHDACRDAPLAKLKTDRGEKLVIATEGIKVGDVINIGKGSSPKKGNILPISEVAKGAYVFGIETVPGSGPKLCCSAGTKGIVTSHDEKKSIIQMPSKAFKIFHPMCLVTVGKPAGGGSAEKKFAKAGQLFFAKKARNKLWPRTSASAMNPVDHPFGGKTSPGQSKSVSRNRPPGAKVGSVASKRTGKRKR